MALWDFPCRQLRHLKIGIILFPPFLSICLFLLFLALLHWVELPVLCLIVLVRADILLPDFRGKMFTIKCDVSCRLSVDPLHQVEEVLYSCFVENFIMHGCQILLNALSVLIDIIV